jgi:uncharacterized protein YbaR (Trm112 family)
MALDAFLLGLLEDPTDHGTLLYIEEDSVLYNPRLRIAYSVNGSIPVLLASEARGVSDDEHEKFVANPNALTTGN